MGFLQRCAPSLTSIQFNASMYQSNMKQSVIAQPNKRKKQTKTHGNIYTLTGVHYNYTLVVTVNN